MRPCPSAVYQLPRYLISIKNGGHGRTLRVGSFKCKAAHFVDSYQLITKMICIGLINQKAFLASIKTKKIIYLKFSGRKTGLGS